MTHKFATLWKQEETIGNIKGSAYAWSKGTMSDLIELQRSYLIGVLNQIETRNNLKFLIIDKAVEKILSYLFLTPQELLNNVTSVDLIDSPTRKGQSSVDAIYLLEPTKYNINCIDADFMVRPPKYRRCHIRFLPGLTNPIFQFFQSKRYICLLYTSRCV